MKKLLSALVIAGLLAGLGCGGDTKTTEKKKEGGATSGTDKGKETKPSDTRKDL